MKKIFLSLVVFLLSISSIYATHNRAGEITYEYVSGYTYRITVTTYTKESSTSADRCELTVRFGDGDTAVFIRVNGPTGLCDANSGAHNGESIGNDTKKNIYQGPLHTYPGPGNYTITMEDQNRNAGICNIYNGNSVNISFSLRTELKINPFLPPNTSPTLLNPPLDDACVGQCFYHNPGAYDAEGDSLSYSLTACSADGQIIGGWVFPPNMPANSINALTGDLIWCSPPIICQYNIAILIKEYKLQPGTHTRYYVGSVLRDMQINVLACNNTAPQIKKINDTCIVAGTNLKLNVKATDAEVNVTNVLTLSATGGPFEVSPKATFTSSPSTSPVNGVFNWTPNCSEVQLLPYQVTFKVTDGDANPLVNFESVFIRVVAPAPTGLTATPSGSSIILNWNAPLCNDTLGKNPFIRYDIYRKNTCDTWVHSPCETGVPSYTGYTLIGTTDKKITTFTDNNGGQGLTHGVDYSYIVVAVYYDGTQSYASVNDCAKLVRDVPIITNVSVTTTDANTGSIWVHWAKPLGISPNLDTIANPPPYEYRLMQAIGMGTNPSTLISTYTYNSYSQLTDTGFVSTGINTATTAWTYRIDFYSNGIFKGSTNIASSVFLSTTASDNKVNLTWQAMVPWINYRYDIYKETFAGSTVFTKIDTAITQSYVDTGLVNGINYCYKIVSIGKYSDPALPSPLYNSSEIKCETPLDKTPPCQPTFSVNVDCGIFKNVLSWTNPNTYCSDDAVKYNIYFSPTTDGDLQLITTITDINTTTYTHEYMFEGVPSVAGCYAVTAVDSFANESPIVNKICVDNCPAYELPNVFTPNDDGKNDFFTPIYPYRYVKDIDITIYDRWGLIMFETKNPDILWDGKNSGTKRMCPDGVYYYICTVNEIRVDGIKPRVLKGFIQMFQEKSGVSH